MHSKNWTLEKLKAEEERLAELWEVSEAAKVLVTMAEDKGGKDDEEGGEDEAEMVKGDDNSEGDGGKGGEEGKGKDCEEGVGKGELDDEFKDGTWWRKGVPRGF
jgi:hypothetical protein